MNHIIKQFITNTYAKTPPQTNNKIHIIYFTNYFPLKYFSSFVIKFH